MRIFVALFILLAIPFGAWAVEADAERVPMAMLRGEVRSAEDNSAVQFAAVIVGDGSRYNVVTDKNGRFRMRIPAGEQTVIVKFLGFEDNKQMVSIAPRGEKIIDVKLQPATTDIEAVNVEGENQVTRINKTAYNVQSISLEELKNTSASVTDALTRMNGVKIRESGGVGSDTNISLNGYSGNHVKIFIDGVQMDTSNSAFSLSNMPANFAERIDVYSGVVPIEFGADAIGGVINVVTNKDYRQEKLSLDASYSYGSFNTHSSYINFGQVFKSGLMYNINFYQNYSDNDYWITPEIYKIDGQSMNYIGTDRVKRFNDAYHNETVVGTVGITNKSWADFLTLKFNYSQYDNEIQTGTTEEVVYGDKTRIGHSMTPTLEYSKRNLLVEGLNVAASASYSVGYTENHEGSGLQWDWYGNSRISASMTGLESEMKNSSLTVNVMAKYSLREAHQFTLSHNFSNANRLTRTMENESYLDWGTPQDNKKNITGLSYRYRPNKRLDVTAFGKNYAQTNEGWSVSDDSSYWATQTNSSLGYGAAASYFLFDGLQAKLSFEKSYRLPTSTEIFGDGDLEQGTFELNPESSYNYNLNVVYGREFGEHNVVVEAALIYRDTRDYIQRSTASDAARGTSSASYENFGMVETKGYTATLRYDYSKYFSIGGTFNNISSRNAEGRLDSTTSSSSTLTYGLRLPNTPYIYANADASLNLFKVFADHDSVSLNYDLFYQYEFPLYWETIGFSDEKMMVPTQVSHNITLNYSIKGGKYNFSFEARNILDATLYDNYMLQKAGRAFYGKVRININKIKK